MLALNPYPENLADLSLNSKAVIRCDPAETGLWTETDGDKDRRGNQPTAPIRDFNSPNERLCLH